MRSDAFPTATLSDACQLITDGSHFSPTPREDGHPIVNAKDIPKGRVELTTCTRISESEWMLLKKQNCSPDPGDVLLSKDGTIGRVVHYKEDLGVVLLSSVAILRPKEFLAPAFLAHVLRSHVFDQQLFGLQSGSALKRLVLGDIKKIKIPIPDSDIQNSIAEILSTLDDAIEQTEALIAKHHQIKAGLMHDLFTRGVTPDGHLRPTREQAPDLYKESSLEWIPKEWDVVPLGGLVRELVAGVSVNSTDNPAGAGQVGVLKTSCVGSGLFHPAENKTVVPEDIARACVSPRRDTILISRMNTPLLVGESGYVPEDFPNLFLPDRLWMTILDETSGVCCRWLAQLIQWRAVREKISGLATGTSGSMKNISKSKLIALELATPKPDEQVAISARLGAIDDQLTTEDGMLAKLRQQKNGLMHDLLTGRVRAPITEQ